MGWQIIPADNAVHVVPERDNGKHFLKWDCPCCPRQESTANGGLIVIHDAYDGRLGVEWANEILK